MWNTKNGGLIVLVLALWTMLAGCTSLQKAKDRFEPSHRVLLGRDWVHMGAAEKAYFVEGYRSGSSAGHSDACDLFSTQDRERLPRSSTSSGVVLDPCDALGRTWSKGTTDLVKQIDAFYSQFPSDRGVHVANLIQNLSDQSGLTIEKIHATGNQQESGGENPNQ
jgi:hypothetical protein